MRVEEEKRDARHLSRGPSLIDADVHQAPLSQVTEPPTSIRRETSVSTKDLQDICSNHEQVPSRKPTGYVGPPCRSTDRVRAGKKIQCIALYESQESERTVAMVDGPDPW